MIAQSAQTLALASIQMPSGAGHDAQAMAAVCPVGMIFVPSEDGASHCGREHTRWEDCVNGANVLLHSVMGLTAQSFIITENQ
jgi:N-carbamoyl-L-amino-acid hydrolase